MLEKMGFRGIYEIISEDVRTGRRTRTWHENIVTQQFYDAVHGFLDHSVSGQAAGVLDANYLAVGDNDATATRGDVALGNEIFRKTYASRTYGDTEFKLTLSLGVTEGNPAGGRLKEIGVFSDASGTAGSGTMISRAVIDVKKNENIKLLIYWYLRSA